MVFNDAEVAMFLAVFVAVDAAQKHDKRRVPDLRPQGKVLGLHSPVFSDAHDENARLKHENHHKKAEKCPQLWSRGVTRWFRRSLAVSDPFVCRCLNSLTMLRFHTPLIEPDRRI
jgi:hypothetical protein